MSFDNAPKSSYTYSSFLEEKNNLQNSIRNSNSNIGTAQTVVDAYKVPCAALDQIIVNKVIQINTKKQQIVTLLTNNFNKYLNNTGGCGIGSTTTDFPSASSNVVVAGTAVTFSYTPPGQFFQVGVGISAEVRADSIYGWCLPVLENNDTSAITYTDGAVYREINSNNLGIGKTDWLYSDTYDPHNLHKNNATLIGGYYPIPSGCSNITNQVATLTNDIVTIRGEITSMLSDIKALKNKKTEKEVLVWYEHLSKQQSSDNLTTVNNAISIMESHETQIVTYEQST